RACVGRGRAYDKGRSRTTALAAAGAGHVLASRTAGNGVPGGRGDMCPGAGPRSATARAGEEGAGRQAQGRGAAVHRAGLRPPRPVRIAVWKGREYWTERRRTRVEAGQVSEVEMKLSRTVPAETQHYRAGDDHLRFARVTERAEETILDLLEAEDIRYGAILG